MIDLTRTYSGEEVNELINIVLDEADKSIENSYQKGYKQATIELKPEIEYWKTKYELKDDADFKSIITAFSVGFGGGLLLGNLSGIFIGIKINVN